MKRTEIRYNLKGLEDIKRQVGDTYIARVGIFRDHTQRTQSGIDNVTLGLIQMFGSITNGIPPRDFLVMPLETKRRELIAAMRSPTVKDALERKDYRKIFEYLGIEAEAIVKQAFESGGYGKWAANKPATIKAKGSDKPLIDTGQLRRAIGHDVVKKGEHSKKAIAPVGMP